MIRQGRPLSRPHHGRIGVSMRCRVGVGALAAVLVMLTVASGAGSAGAVAPAWSVPAQIGKSSGGAPSLSMNSAGTAIAVWGRTVATIGAVYESVATAGQPWHRGVAVGSTSAYDSRDPSVALDESGAAVASFKASQIDGYSSAYMSAFRFANGTWGNFQIVSSPVSGPGSRVRFAGSSTSAINDAVMVTATTNPCNFWASVNPSDNYWSVESDITTDCVSKYDFALDRSGAGAVAFVTTGGVVEVATRTALGVWSTPTVLATVTKIGAVAVSVDPAGDATVVYSAGAKKPFAVSVARLAAGGAWSAPAGLTSTACSSDVATATTPSGTAVVAWSATVAKHCEITAAMGTVAAGLGAPVAVTSGAKATAVAAVATSGGNFVLAWNNASTLASAVGDASGFGPVAVIGSAGRPVLAAGGGVVSVVACHPTCDAASLALS